jgi:hypothetical protein
MFQARGEAAMNPDPARTEYATADQLFIHAPDGSKHIRSAYHGLAHQLGVPVAVVISHAQRDELRSLFQAPTPAEQLHRFERRYFNLSVLVP